MNRRALIIVDMQNDFAHKGFGALYVPGGETALPVIEDLAREVDYVVLTQDWHRRGDPSFKSEGGPWPEHCVRGTWGAELYSPMRRDIGDAVIRKTGYSAFRDEDGGHSGLYGLLRDQWIDHVTVVGLALDHCVKVTALHAAVDGFTTRIVMSGTRAVDIHQIPAVLAEFRKNGVEVV